MAEVTTADLANFPRSYESSRAVGDVLVGEDAAPPLIEASSSGNDAALRSLLSQPQWIKTMLEQPHTIYKEDRPREGPNDVRQVTATPIINANRALEVAAQNGHAAVVSTLLNFVNDQDIPPYEIDTRKIMSNAIKGNHAAVIKVLASADPDIVDRSLGHSQTPIYDAVKFWKPEVVIALLECGADALRPPSGWYKDRTGPRSSLMSFAATTEGTRMTELLLEKGVPIAGTGALHFAAQNGHLDTMRLLIQHGADVNEAFTKWSGRTPMHFAAANGVLDAMKLLEENGARSDVKDNDGKTPAQLLEEHNKAQH